MFFDIVGGSERTSTSSFFTPVCRVCSSVGVSAEDEGTYGFVEKEGGGETYCKGICSLVPLFIYSANSY